MAKVGRKRNKLFHIAIILFIVLTGFIIYNTPSFSYRIKGFFLPKNYAVITGNLKQEREYKNLNSRMIEYARDAALYALSQEELQKKLDFVEKNGNGVSWIVLSIREEGGNTWKIEISSTNNLVIYICEIFVEKEGTTRYGRCGYNK